MPKKSVREKAVAIFNFAFCCVLVCKLKPVGGQNINLSIRLVFAVVRLQFHPIIRSRAALIVRTTEKRINFGIMEDIEFRLEPDYAIFLLPGFISFIIFIIFKSIVISILGTFSALGIAYLQSKNIAKFSDSGIDIKYGFFNQRHINLDYRDVKEIKFDQDIMAYGYLDTVMSIFYFKSEKIKLIHIPITAGNADKIPGLINMLTFFNVRFLNNS